MILTKTSACFLPVDIWININSWFCETVLILQSFAIMFEFLSCNRWAKKALKNQLKHIDGEQKNHLLLVRAGGVPMSYRRTKSENKEK